MNIVISKGNDMVNVTGGEGGGGSCGSNGT